MKNLEYQKCFLVRHPKTIDHQNNDHQDIHVHVIDQRDIKRKVSLAVIKHFNIYQLFIQDSMIQNLLIIKKNKKTTYIAFETRTHV